MNARRCSAPSNIMAPSIAFSLFISFFPLFSMSLYFQRSDGNRFRFSDIKRIITHLPFYFDAKEDLVIRENMIEVPDITVERYKEIYEETHAYCLPDDIRKIFRKMDLVEITTNHMGTSK
jgi:hypothetical protein